MTRKLKVLGLALVAVFAMSAVMSSAASAAFFNSEGTPTPLTGTQVGENEFIVNGQAVKCKIATFKGTVTGTKVESATVTPAYSECTYGAVKVDVTISAGCTYTLSAVTNAEGHGKVKVTCTGEPIKVTFTELDGAGTDCTLTIATQEPNGGASYTNEGAGTTRDIKVKATVTGITTTADPSGEPQTKCKALAVGKAKYEGSVTVKGYTDATHATHRGIFYS